ncbi:MAG: type II 3-dehydroquinate dehydratase [Alphaproteobacteria bacterium]
MTKPVFILNGPNLNMLGTREPAVYGTTTLGDIEGMCRARAEALGRAIVFRQSNHEGELVDWIHEAIGTAAAIVINPAGYSFTSVAIMDALKMFPGPIVELHISNIHRREPIYHHSRMSAVATAVIAGLGAEGYPLALDATAMLLRRAA